MRELGTSDINSCFPIESLVPHFNLILFKPIDTHKFTVCRYHGSGKELPTPNDKFTHANKQKKSSIEFSRTGDN